MGANIGPHIAVDVRPHAEKRAIALRRNLDLKYTSRE